MTSRYDDAVDVTDPVIDLLEDLRPQPYGLVRSDRIADPIVEPQWGGLRVLAAVEDGAVALRDEAGEPVTERPEVDRALGAARSAPARRSSTGYLTKQPTAEIVYADAVPATCRRSGALMAKPFIGDPPRPPAGAEGAGRAARRGGDVRRRRSRRIRGHRPPPDRRRFAARRPAARAQAPPRFGRDAEQTSSVSAPTCGHRSRRGSATWRRLGFLGLSFRAANSRYHPGEKHDDWTLVPMPRR